MEISCLFNIELLLDTNSMDILVVIVEAPLVKYTFYSESPILRDFLNKYFIFICLSFKQ